MEVKVTCFTIFVLTSQLFLVCCSGQNQTNDGSLDCLKAPELVQIECRVVNADAECVDKNVISVEKTARNDEFGVINCTSPAPIDVSFMGFQLNDYVDVSYVRNAENVFNEATYVFSIAIPLSNIKASREIVVSHNKDLEQKRAFVFFLYRPGDKMFSSNFKPYLAPLTPPQEVLPIEFLERELVIPCIANDPKIEPTLQVPDVVKKVEKVYNTKGFQILTGNQTSFISANGTYTCKAAEETVVFEVLPAKNAIFEPPMDNIYLFGNSELRISCKYSEQVILEGTFKGKPITQKPIVSYSSVLQFESQYVEPLANVGDSGRVICKTLAGKELKRWDIQILNISSNDILQVNHVLAPGANQIICKSSKFPLEKMRMKHVFCQGETECRLNEFCFHEGKEISSCTRTLNAVPCEGNNALCLTLPSNETNYSQGMIRCSAGDHFYQTKFFTGFDKQFYLDWRQAPVNALIDIYVPPDNVTMYPQNSYPFGCKTAKFYSDGRLQWVIRGKDGSEILLHKNRLQELRGVYASELDYQLYTVRESNIRLIYPNDYDVICMVPMWNATGWIRHHKRINVAAKEAPVKEIVSGASAIIVVLLGVVVYVLWRLKKARDEIRNLTEKEVEEFMKGNPEALKNNTEKDTIEVIDALPYDQKFEIPREKLLIDMENVLGKGAFGTVLKGKIDGITDVVAVKTVNSDCQVNQFKQFMSELKIMIYIGKHANIVSLIGASTEKLKEKTLYIVVEYCCNGSLESYLRRYKGCYLNQIVNDEINIEMDKQYENVSAPNSPSTSTDSIMSTCDLIRWCYQIATGMEYLSLKKVVHADLATRNILLDFNGNAKITDFGLSRQLMNYTQYVKKNQEPLPWRWMAIESLQQLRFSTHSDVWAYGVLIWEIFTHGDIPYPGLSWDIQFVHKLVNGLRLIKPMQCTTGIYNLMSECWHETPEDRPTFAFIALYFKAMLENLNVELEAVAKKQVQGEVTLATYTNISSFIPSYTMVSELPSNTAERRSNMYINS